MRERNESTFVTYASYINVLYVYTGDRKNILQPVDLSSYCHVGMHKMV